MSEIGANGAASTNSTQLVCPTNIRQNIRHFELGGKSRNGFLPEIKQNIVIIVVPKIVLMKLKSEAVKPSFSAIRKQAASPVMHIVARIILTTAKSLLSFISGFCSDFYVTASSRGASSEIFTVSKSEILPVIVRVFFQDLNVSKIKINDNFLKF